MLQRYDITRDDQTNQLSIKEFAVLETKSRKRNDYKPDRRDYSLIHEVSYNSDIIRAAIKEGPEVLISELRTRDFFPIYPCIELIANNVIDDCRLRRQSVLPAGEQPGSSRHDGRQRRLVGNHRSQCASAGEADAARRAAMARPR